MSLAVNKELFNNENQLTIDLFHGTSTLFLDSIIKNGLGGKNQIFEWNLLELTREVYELSKGYLKDTKLYRTSSWSFEQMAKQSNETFNFQHGETYLSPSSITATKYAVNKEYGSELLTYTMKFLRELLSKDIPYVKNDLKRKYPELFRLLDAKPSPILIRVKNVTAESLLDEHGEEPHSNFKDIRESMKLSKELFETTLQQTNFRLNDSVLTNNLEFWLIDVSPEWKYYKILDNPSKVLFDFDVN
jgi:hypothetical protein